MQRRKPLSAWILTCILMCAMTMTIYAHEVPDNISSPELAQKLSRYVSDHQISGVTQSIGRDGMIAFENLEPGLYLIVQNQAASGYYKAEPFLVSVPMNENGVYLYTVDASPKIELIRKDSGRDPEPPTEPTPGESTPTDPPPTEPGNPGGDSPENEVPETDSHGQEESRLPQTGQLNWPIPILVVAGLGLFSAGWMMRFGKKKEGHES